jgi:hypothetical protein
MSILHRRLATLFLCVAFAVPILAHSGSNQSSADTRQAKGDGMVSFSNDIQPIFDARCTRCHNPDLFRGTLDLTQGNAYANLVSQPTSEGCMAEVPDSVRVVPFDPQSSMIWLKTMPDDSRCGRPMPLGTDGLGIIAPDEFALIETWIVQGALDN